MISFSLALLARGQRKYIMISPVTDKLNNQPSGWGRLAAWLAKATQVGQCLAARVTVGGAANALALMVWSGVCLSSFSAEPLPPPIAEVGGAGEVVNNARVTPFILVVKTDQMDEKKPPVAVGEADDQKTKKTPSGKPFLTSGPNQFRLPLHPFAHYDFTIRWGDGTTQVVRSDVPDDQLVIDEAWLAQVKKGLDQPVTLDFENVPDDLDDFRRIDDNEYETERCLRYLLKNAGMDLCGQIFIDPKVLASGGLDMVRSRKLWFEAMKLSDVFEQLTKVSGLTYLLHDRALVIAEHKDLPTLVCPQHTYAQAGTYRIEITENVRGGFPLIYFNSCFESTDPNTLFPQMQFNDGYDCVKVMDLAQWGSNTWMSMNRAFSGCVNMTISASDGGTALTGTVVDFNKAWLGCRGLINFPLLNTSAATQFNDTWKGCAGLTSFPMLNTSAVTTFLYTWSGCSGLTSFPLLNTVAGTDFEDAWSGCSSLTSFPLLNTSAGTTFLNTWSGCSGLTSFPLLNTSAGTCFVGTWERCSGLTSFPLLNTSAGTDFGAAWCECSGLTSFPLLNVSAGTEFSLAWHNCRGLTSFPLLDTSAGTDFGSAWYGCSGLTSFPLLNTVAGARFSGAWLECSSLTSFPLLNTSAGTYFGSAWSGCAGLMSFPLLNTSAGTDFKYAWYECSGLRNFPLLNTVAGTDFSGAWRECSGLTSFPLLNTSAGTNFSCAWSGCSVLTSFPLLDTSAGTDFGSAWQGCSGLTSFPLLDTSAGTDFSGAWAGCSGLTSFPLLDTSAGTNFGSTWRGAWIHCRGLTSFPLLNTSAGINFTFAWYGCSGLTSFPLLDTSAGTYFIGAWGDCSGLKSFPLLNFGNMEKAEACFSGVTFTSASYGELLANIAALNNITKVKFAGGFSKAQGLIGIQAREKLIKKLGWTIIDGDTVKSVSPALPQEANDL